MNDQSLNNTILVCGGAGFIGSNFVRLVVKKKTSVVVVDKLTYAGHRKNLEEVERSSLFNFILADIGDRARMEALLRDARPRAVVNFAAETHVDRSIDGPEAFVQTNVMSMFQLLEASRAYWSPLSSAEKNKFRFVQISTDEVFGSLGKTGRSKENSAYRPNSPYAASKAAADHLVRSAFVTYGFPAIITNCSNNFGPYQFPEKLMPLMILTALEGKPLPVYGDGKNVRDWIYVEDHCEGIWGALAKGKPGESYNIGANEEKTNLETVRAICRALEKVKPAKSNPALAAKGVHRYDALISFVKDRPGHDRRYALDAGKIRREIGWRPRYEFEKALEKTIRWYLSNADWCEAVQSGNYHRERLGVKS